MGAEDATQNEELSIKLPGGPSVNIRGRDVVLIGIIVVLCGAVFWLASFSLKSWGEPFNLKYAFEAHDLEIQRQHTSYINGVQELTYVMSVCLNQARKDECQNLRLAMPDSLYRKLNNGVH